MPETLTYCFTLQSPWSYLGHADFLAIAQRHGCAVAWRPVELQAVFPESGGLPFAKRHPARRNYRDLELKRWRVERGIVLNLRPAFWPVDIGLADRVVIALVEAGADPDGYVRRAFAALWAEDADLADEATLVGLLEADGQDARMLAAAKSDAVRDLYGQFTREALTAGVFGAPTYLRRGEPFWGQDRLPSLDRAIASGRDPLTLDVTPPPR